MPEVTDGRLVLRSGIWCRLNQQPNERWSADAAADPIRTAIATTGTEAERVKSAADIEFLLDSAVDGIVLDLGCGYGRVAKYLLPARTFEGYVGIDGSMTMLQLFLERYQSNDLEQRTPLLLMHGSIEDIKLPNGSVDNVVIAAVLLHNSKRMISKVLREVRRVLRPGGRLIVLSDLPNSRTLAALPARLYVLALRLSGQGEKNGPVRSYSRSELDGLFRDFQAVAIHTKGHAILPKSLPGLPEPLSSRYRKFIHDPVQRWSEQNVPSRLLDRMYANANVNATR